MAESLERTLVCHEADFASTNKKRVKIGDRDITIIKAKNKFYALDSFCYHAGGPIHRGDIEELGGRLCIICPWHSYKVCLDSGQNYYQMVDPYNMEKPPEWRAGDVRQRTHPVTVEEGQIFVQLTPMDGSLDSDRHNKQRTDSPQ